MANCAHEHIVAGMFSVCSVYSKQYVHIYNLYIYIYVYIYIYTFMYMVFFKTIERKG